MFRVSTQGLRTAACAIVLAAATAGAASASPLFVYKGNGSDGRKALPNFEKYIGKKADGVIDFIAFDSWTSFDNDAGWGIGGWKGSGYQLAESVPLTVQGTSLADVAAGKQDAHYTKLAQTLINNGFPDAYLRLGWEFNGGWYPWAFKGHERDYSAAFRHVVQIMRAVPGAKFKIVWNPALLMQQQWPDVSYPGDDVVDIIATDVYDQSWDAGYTDPNKRWNSILNDSWGVQGVVDFAKKHNKPYAFPEWGVGTRPDGHGGGDDPTFVKNMAPYVAKAAFTGYWDFPAADFNGMISNGQYPKAGAEFVADYGSGANAQAPAAPTPTPTPSPTPTSPPPTVVAPVSTPATVSAPKFWAVASGGAQAALTPNSDGTLRLALSFPVTAATHNYSIWLQSAREVFWTDAFGKVTSWGRMSVIGWASRGGSATVKLSAK